MHAWAAVHDGRYAHGINEVYRYTRVFPRTGKTFSLKTCNIGETSECIEKYERILVHIGIHVQVVTQKPRVYRVTRFSLARRQEYL